MRVVRAAIFVSLVFRRLARVRRDLECFVSSCHQSLMDLKSESEQQVVWTLGQNSEEEFCSDFDSPPFWLESSGLK